MAITTLNTAPIYTGTPKVSGTRITTAVNNSQGSGTIGTEHYLAFSAGANGSYLQKVRFTLGGATANTASTAAVLRVYLSTQSSGAITSANTWLVQEVTAASQTPNVITTLTGATYPIDIPLNFAIPTGYHLLVASSAVTSANTVWTVTTYGGDY
jgi:hypothetical protein